MVISFSSSLSLFGSLVFFLSLILFVCISLSLPLVIWLSFCLSFCVSRFLPLCLSSYIFLSLVLWCSLCLSVCLCISPSPSLSSSRVFFFLVFVYYLHAVCPSSLLPLLMIISFFCICLIIYLFSCLHMSIHLSICIRICTYIHVYLSIYFSVSQLIYRANSFNSPLFHFLISLAASSLPPPPFLSRRLVRASRLCPSLVNQTTL